MKSTLKRLLVSAAGAIAILLAINSPALAQVAKPDSVQSSALGALPPSNCPNIQTQWYASGVVPAGYYKQGASPFHCLPIPACTGNQAFDQNTAACGCPAGTVWNATHNSCHTPCAGGTAWNGTACANVCSAGTAWNGTSCASICSAGTSWDGSSCASVCSAGTSWNGSSCTSVCSGGQSWDGAACACPAGQSFQGGACGTAPVVSAFSITPTSVLVGANHTVAWTASGSGNLNMSLHCTGDNAASFALTPPQSGTGSLAAARPGTTNCVAQASNEWGTSPAVNAPSLTASCPPGSSWNGTSCSIAANNDLVNKTVYVQGLSGTGSYIPVFRIVGVATGIRVYSAANTLMCTLTGAGQSCASTSQLINYVRLNGVNGDWRNQTTKFCANLSVATTETVCRWVPKWNNSWCNNSVCQASYPLSYWVDWNADGSLQLFSYHASAEGADTYTGGPYARGIGSISKAEMLSAPVTSTVQLPGGVWTGNTGCPDGMAQSGSYCVVASPAFGKSIGVGLYTSSSVFTTMTAGPGNAINFSGIGTLRPGQSASACAQCYTGTGKTHFQQTASLSGARNTAIAGYTVEVAANGSVTFYVGTSNQRIQGGGNYSGGTLTLTAAQIAAMSTGTTVTVPQSWSASD